MQIGLEVRGRKGEFGMKKEYRKPLATKVRFSFENTVVATGEPVTGQYYRPTHPTICQWSAGPECRYNYSSGYDCQNGPYSLLG